MVNQNVVCVWKVIAQNEEISSQGHQVAVVSARGYSLEYRWLRVCVLWGAIRAEEALSLDDNVLKNLSINKVHINIYKLYMQR